MIWVNRTGVKALYLRTFLENSKIYLPWDGYCEDLSSFETIDDYKKLVVAEKGNLNRTSLSNWAGQLFTFAKGMNVGDYVLIPHESSRKYTFAKITGDYHFSGMDQDNLWHSRSIQILINEIPREAFSQSMQYSLGAFRTIFKVKNEDECLSVLKQFM